MAKYRKKPVVVDAIQMIDSKNSVNEVIIFINGENNVKQEWINDGYYEDVKMQGYLDIKTPEGYLKASFGDWIVKGESKDLGVHFWPVKPDYFEENYEPLEPTIGCSIKGDIIL